MKDAASELVWLLADEGVQHLFFNPGTDTAPIQEALAKHYDLQAKLFRSKDAIEGPLAFSQKRKPNWTGE